MHRFMSSLQQCLNCASRWYTANRLVLDTTVQQSAALCYIAHLFMTKKINFKLDIANTGIEYNKMAKYLGV